LIRSTIAALNPWSFRQYSAGGAAAHALSCLAASRSHAVICRLHRRRSRRMNADPRSAFRLSPLQEPTARARAGRFNVRATSRTCMLRVANDPLRRTSRIVGVPSARRGQGALPSCVSWPPSRRSAIPAADRQVPWTRKNPMSLMAPGFWVSSRSCGQVSQAQRMPGQRIRRIIGYTPRASRFGLHT
jgi:hypothetical protein